jgi:hypothetical protein
MRMPINECSWVQTVWCLLKRKTSNHRFLMTNDKLGGFFCVSDSYLVISSLWSGDIRIDEIWFFITLHSLIAEGYRSYKIIIKKTIVLFIAIILEKKGWVNLLFVDIWCEWDKCIVARNWLILLLMNICV